MEFAMSATIMSTTAVRAAHEATASVLLKWATAYDATRSDIASGASVREIADAWKAAKISPANSSQVSDMAEAARLTDVGETYWEAVYTVIGEGVVLYPHALILRARKARGMAYVRATLSAMEAVLSVEDVTDEDIRKAMVKAVRTLNAAKREKVKDDVSDDVTTGEGDEGDSETGDAPATADSRADSVIAVLSAMLKDGDMPSEDHCRTMVALMRELTGAWKANAEAAA